MKGRSASEIAGAMRRVYRIDEPVMFELLPGDHAGIAAIELIALWLKESELAREDFRDFRKKVEARHAKT